MAGWISLVLVAVTLTSVPAANALVAAPQVKIVSPEAGATTSGTLTVQFSATYTEDAQVTQATVSLGVRWRSVSVPLPRTGCDTGCRATARFDTVATQGAPGQAGYMIPDGELELTVTLQGAAEIGLVRDELVFSVDNDRPRVSLDPPPQSGGLAFPYSANEDLKLSAHASPGPKRSAAVTAVEFHSDEVVGRHPFSRSTSSLDAWSMSISTGELPEGGRRGFVVVTDSRGVVGLPVAANFMVIHGFTLYPPELPSPISEEQLGDVQLSYSYAYAFWETYPAWVTTLIDGVEYGRAIQCCTLTSKPGTVTARLDRRPPSGTHIVKYIVEDNRGIVRSIELSATIEHSFLVDIKGAGARVVAGSPLEMSALLTATYSPIKNWDIAVDGHLQTTSWSCESECPMSHEARWTFTHMQPGPHRVEILVNTERGFRISAGTTVTVEPYLPADPLIGPGDFAGPYANDLLSRRPGGVLWLQEGGPDGSLDRGRQVGHGWGSFTGILGPGDWNGDRKVDVIGRDASGRLWLYPGDGTGLFLSRRQIGKGWSGLTIVAPGDWNGDAKNDLLARDSSGRLWQYPGNGAGGFLPRRQVGKGWAGFTAILTPGDWNGDRRPDLLARDRGGRLWLYPGNGSGGFGRSSQIGNGWSGMNALVGPGDMDWDGKADLYARDSSGTTWLYRGNGKGGFLTRRVASRNWY